ncbi:hypothetical protein LTR66_014778, partial [Elasticomyces elasticus]
MSTPTISTNLGLTMNTIPPTDPPPFRFLDLPLEIRTTILHHIFEPWTMYVTKVIPQKDSPCTISGLPKMAPLRVNKWFHTEGLKAFKQNCTHTMTFESNMFFYRLDQTGFDQLSHSRVMTHVRHIKNAPEDILNEEWLAEDW